IQVGALVEREMNKERAKRAVLVQLVVQGSGLALSLDDAVQVHGQSGTWKQAELFTSKLIDEGAFDRLDFDEKGLADFGYYVLARLHAFKAMGEAP
ncbi:MAG: hypothetical protein ACREP7_03495, partial [Lysobacter sp.]